MKTTSLLLLKCGLSAETVRRQSVLMLKKGSCGRGGLKPYAVEAIAKDYERLKSCAAVGKLYGRSRQVIWEILKKRDRTIPKKALERIVWEGLNFTPGKSGYFRCTQFGRKPLHVMMWLKAGRMIPAGHVLVFIDGDRSNVRLENLVCVEKSEGSRLVHGRLYPERNGWTPEQKREFWRAYCRDYMARRAAKWIAKGLRSDGLPRAVRAERNLKFEIADLKPKPRQPRRTKLTAVEESYAAFREEITKKAENVYE